MLSSVFLSVLACMLASGRPAPLQVPPQIQHDRLVHHVSPIYPELARRARIQGTVRLAALVDENGLVERLKLLSGHPFLVPAAFDAVKQWRYRPTLDRGVPVAVLTVIEVTFTYSPNPRIRPRQQTAGELDSVVL